MNAGKLCGIAIIIVVVCPIIIGTFWPTETETVDIWETEPALDITGDLANKDVYVYDTYTGPLNNLSIADPARDLIVFPTPRNTTATPNSYPVSAIDETVTAQSVTISHMQQYGKSRYGIGDYNGFTITGDSGTYTFADYWPSTNTLILYNQGPTPEKTITPRLTDAITGNLTIAAYGSPTAYMDTTAGLVGSSSPFVWVNGMKNDSVTFWINMTRTPFSNTVTIDNVSLTWNAGMLTVSDGQRTEDLGSAYDFVSVTISRETATVSGLIGVDSFADNGYTIGNTIELASASAVDYVVLRGTYMSWWAKSSVSAIGSTKGIQDSSFTPESYYGAHSWQAQIVNPSRFGTGISIKSADNSIDMTWLIEDGNIPVTNSQTGEQFSQEVRGLRILSLILDGQQKIYVGGVEIASTGTPQNFTITLDGEWYTSAVVSKVVQGQKTNYVWKPGSFGFDTTEFCMVGIMACAAMSIAGSLWGRTSGSSVLALHITMIVCGVAYLCMIM